MKNKQLINLLTIEAKCKIELIENLNLDSDAIKNNVSLIKMLIGGIQVELDKE